MLRAIKFIVDRTIIRLVRYVWFAVSPPRGSHNEVFRIVTERAASSSADYIEGHLDGALLFPTREQVWDFALSKARVEGLYGEFGVFEGHSINHMAGVLQARHITIYGFDSFEGLKEDWRGTWYAQGAFDVGGKLPKVLPNVTLVKGWFDETVPKFLTDHPDKPFSFIHIDSDTFEAASLVLALLKDRIVKGTVLVFDEYLGFPNWKNGEFAAWRDFVAAQGIEYCYLAFSNTPAAVLVL
jgi:hypothetical protein